MDEIVVVDGGPEGPSTDGTAEIAQAHPKVVYLSGVFQTMDGAWDNVTQRNTGINAATGDILMMMSADWLFLGLEHLREAIDEGVGKIFFCPVVEFWEDVTRMRLYEGDGVALSLPSGVVEAAAIDASLGLYYAEDGGIRVNDLAPDFRVQVPQATKYHLGWIRPFDQQTQKHIRHVRQHRWDDIGEKLLQGEDVGLLQWAMRHVLGYPQQASIGFSGELPVEMNGARDMSYNKGAKEATDRFEETYGHSLFREASND